MNGRRIFVLCCFLALFLPACKHHQKEFSGSLDLNFLIQVDGEDLVLHNLIYQNAAGNTYQVDEVKFFVSQVELISENGEKQLVALDNGAHYYDYDIASTHHLKVDEMKLGQYDSISFVFGLLPEQNVTGYFVNPPENNMAWPDALGGGYHYMQINGKWLNTSNFLSPFNLHTGRGQTYSRGEINGFVENWFRVSLPLSDFAIRENQTSTLNLVMNVNAWFASPNLYDFNVLGGSIMQNQAVQQMLRENGANVFSIR